MKPTIDPIGKFLSDLLNDGRLNTADIEILKAHASLPDRSGTSWQIAEAAANAVVERWSLVLEDPVKKDIPEWRQVPSWHTVDCLYRWLGHALAQYFPYYDKQIRERTDGTKRWWMALGEAVKTTNGKVTMIRLRAEIADALAKLNF